jgi:hypothetical protein
MNVLFYALTPRLKMQGAHTPHKMYYYYYYYCYYGDTSIRRKLALTSPTSGLSVGIVCSRTEATEFSLVYSPLLILYTVGRTPWKGYKPVARPLPTQRSTQTEHTCMPFEPTIPVLSGRRQFIPYLIWGICILLRV